MYVDTVANEADPMLALFARAEQAPDLAREPWARRLCLALIGFAAFASLAIIVALAALAVFVIVLVLANPDNWFGVFVFVREQIGG